MPEDSVVTDMIRNWLDPGFDLISNVRPTHVLLIYQNDHDF